MQRLLGSWAHSDSAGAASFLQSLPAGKSRDAAISSFVGSLAYQEPEMAAPWAASIADEGARHRQMEMVAQNWLRFDSAAATAWINQSSLPQDVRNRLLQQARRN
jgi:hypothetical protein